MPLYYTGKNISLLKYHFKRSVNVLPQLTLNQLSFDYLIGSNVLSHATSTKISKAFWLCKIHCVISLIFLLTPVFPVPEHVISYLEPSVVLSVMPVGELLLLISIKNVAVENL